MITNERALELALISLIEMAGKEVSSFKELTEALDALLQDIHDTHISLKTTRQERLNG